MKLPQPYASVEMVPENEQPLPLGTRAKVHAAVSEHFPGTDWTDPSWGSFDSPFGSIEFNLGSNDLADGMMLHVRASEEIVAAIIALCRTQNWSALDCGSGEFLEQADDPAFRLQQWRAFCDRVIDQ